MLSLFLERPPSLTLFEVALLDTERTKNTDGCVFVAEIVRFRLHLHRLQSKRNFNTDASGYKRNRLTESL